MAVSSSLPGETGDIVAYKGDTFKRWVRIHRNGVPEVLTGSTFRMQIKNGNVIVKELSTTGGSITIDGVNAGILILTLPASETAAMDVGAWRYDMQQTFADTTVQTRFKGLFTITDDITKPLA